MRRCLELSKKGLGTTRPNPSVGAVLVCDGQIIGEGYTSVYGGSHAEVNAIQSVKDKTRLQESTLYVTLEPCVHFGKTPPCTDLILSSKIPKVVIGCIDTHHKVAGKGVERLLKAGCQVVVGVLEDECIEQHKRFFCVQNRKRPYIILKWAETLDGFIAPKEKKQDRPVWISNVASQQLVHKWRTEEHAVLVGTNTAVADNPKLTARTWKGMNPIRIVLDSNMRIPLDYSLFDGDVLTLVFIDTKFEEIAISKDNITYVAIDFTKEISNQICEVLLQHNIQSVIVEGGAQTLQTFIDSGLWDEANVFVGPILFGDGIKSPRFFDIVYDEIAIKDTKLRRYKNLKQSL